MHGMRVRSLSQEDPLEKEKATHSSILAWKFPHTGVWWATIQGLQKSCRWCTDWTTALLEISSYSTCSPLINSILGLSLCHIQASHLSATIVNCLSRYHCYILSSHLLATYLVTLELNCVEWVDAAGSGVVHMAVRGTSKNKGLEAWNSLARLENWRLSTEVALKGGLGEWWLKKNQPTQSSDAWPRAQTLSRTGWNMGAWITLFYASEKLP